MLSFIIYLSVFFGAAFTLGMMLPAAFTLLRPYFILMFLILAFSLLPFGGGGGNMEEGSLYRQVTWGFIFLYSLYLAMRSDTGKYRFPMELIPLPLLLLLTYVAVSVSWSPFPIVSAKRAIQTVGVVFIALALAQTGTSKNYGLRKILFTPATIFLLLGFAMIALRPSLAFGLDHGFEGVTNQKNTWGEFSLIGSMVMLLTVVARERLRLAWPLLVLFSVSLVMAKSATSLVVYLLLIAGILAWLAVTSQSIFGKILLIAIAVISVLATFIYFITHGEWPFTKLMDFAFSSLGRTTTLTGRTFLWMLMREQIAHHPWFGIGYGGFWLGMQGPSAQVIIHLDWGPPVQAHDGYLDILNETGIIGLCLLITALLFHLKNLGRLYVHGEKAESIFHFALLFSCLFLNITESTLMRTTQMWWIILTISIIEVHTRLRRMAAVNVGSEHIPSINQPGEINAAAPARS